MRENLKCFISAQYETDTSTIKNILAENNVEVFDVYDFSIGESIQQILKRKIRQSDFALFVISQDNQNVLYEMGVCEGMGKQHFIFLDKDYKVPFYVENKLFLRANLNDRKLLQLSIENILQEVRKNKKSFTRNRKSKEGDRRIYNQEIKENLRSYLNQISNIRESGHGRELEYLVEEIFKTTNLNYVQNLTYADKGVDFALWNDELGRVIGNPIIVEVKYGNLTKESFKNAEYQIKRYTEQSDAKLALLLYLDKRNKRHKIQSSLRPLIISYDIEDFVKDLISESFENIILRQRNKIAHGLD
ncbi:MAG: toll/interleukin-1 receptor domain-containing protein [Candidatus Marinimicrobia bacterium]|nr:toll/interleukin-1 receptor domain-containing protein [Candidatus Neomarinimicrobiota bacterium]